MNDELKRINDQRKYNEWKEEKEQAAKVWDSTEYQRKLLETDPAIYWMHKKENDASKLQDYQVEYIEPQLKNLYPEQRNKVKELMERYENNPTKLWHVKNAGYLGNRPVFKGEKIIHVPIYTREQKLERKEAKRQKLEDQLAHLTPKQRKRWNEQAEEKKERRKERAKELREEKKRNS